MNLPQEIKKKCNDKCCLKPMYKKCEKPKSEKKLTQTCIFGCQTAKKKGKKKLKKLK